MSEKLKSTSPSAIQLRNWCQTIDIEERLDVISGLEKGEQIVDICLNVTLTQSSVSTVFLIVLIKLKCAKSGTEVNATGTFY